MATSKKQQPPFVINDHRLGIITCGEGHVNFNLVGRQLFAGTLVYLGPGTIINPICFSEDFELIGIGLFADFPNPAFFCKYFKRLTAMTPLEYRGKE